MNTRVLITRPKRQANHLAKMIADAGGQTILFPTINITNPDNPQIVTNTIKQINQYDIIIFTSANAVLLCATHWPKTTIKPSIIAIGPGTANALTQQQIQVHHIPELIQKDERRAFNSEGLLALPILQKVSNKHIAIFTGKGGRKLLANTLKQRGANVDKIVCYQRQLPKERLEQTVNCDIIVSTSVESLKNLVALTNTSLHDWLFKQQLLVISNKMAQTAKKLGFQFPAIIAENASDDAIFKALWYAKAL